MWVSCRPPPAAPRTSRLFKLPSPDAGVASQDAFDAGHLHVFAGVVDVEFIDGGDGVVVVGVAVGCRWGFLRRCGCGGFRRRCGR